MARAGRHGQARADVGPRHHVARHRRAPAAFLVDVIIAEQRIADLLGTGYAGAYNQATQLATSDRNAALQAAFATQGKDVTVASSTALAP